MATNRVKRVKSYKLPMVWVRVRLRDVITPVQEVADHTKEKQTKI